MPLSVEASDGVTHIYRRFLQKIFQHPEPTTILDRIRIGMSDEFEGQGRVRIVEEVINKTPDQVLRDEMHILTEDNPVLTQAQHNVSGIGVIRFSKAMPEGAILGESTIIYPADKNK